MKPLGNPCRFFLNGEAVNGREEKRRILKVLSVLLQYPDKELSGAFQELCEAIQTFSHAAARSACQGFLAYLESSPLLSAQEEYTRTFDLNPATCLNLTFHQWGESAERGEALALLNRLYKNAGYEISASELPDYLPLVLEFISVVPPEEASQVLALFTNEIRGVGLRLREQGSPYGGLLEVLSIVSHELTRGGD